MDSKNQKLKRSTELLRSFLNVQKNLMRFVHKTAVENGLSIPQYSILMTIAPHKEMTQKYLGEKTFLPKSTLSQAIDGLVQAGWLNRQQVEGNRREMQLTISEKGEALVKTIYLHEGGVHEVFQSAVETLTERQYEETLEVHLQISNYLGVQATERGAYPND
jgi:DNA-binding MarR family transcriptional regulator